jgi:hypothetical protein
MFPYLVASSSNSRYSAAFRFGLAASITSWNLEIVSWTWLFKIGWGHQRECFTVSHGIFRQCRVATGSIRDPRGYLLWVWDQSPGYVEAFGRISLRIRFYEVIFYSEGTQQSIHPYSLALCRYHLVLNHYHVGSPGVPFRGPIPITLPLQDAAFGALGPQIHHRRASCQTPRWLICDIGDEYTNLQWACPGVSFPTVGRPSCLPLCCFSASNRTLLPVPVRLSEVFRFVSRAGCSFLPLFRKGSYPGYGLASHSSNTLIVLCLFARFWTIDSHSMSWSSLFGALL